MPLRRSNLIALAAAGIGLFAAAATRSQPTTSDAAEVASWVRWVHDAANTGRGMVERLRWLLSHAEKTADAVLAVLASADGDQPTESMAKLRELEPLGDAMNVRLVCTPTRPEMPAAPMPPQVTQWRWASDAKALHTKTLHKATCGWSEGVRQQAECVSMDAVRLSRDAQRVVWFKM